MPISSAAQGDIQYILNGGAVLHRISFKGGKSYDQIFHKYVQYVSNHFGKPVVLDGFQNGPSTKVMTHIKRAGPINGQAVVRFFGIKIFSGKKELFFSNTTNKQHFIHLRLPPHPLQVARKHISQGQKEYT